MILIGWLAKYWKETTGYILGAAAAAASLYAGLSMCDTWQLPLLIWLSGGTFGWILGIVASPTKNEEQKFLKYAKTASAVVTGYLLSKAEQLFNIGINNPAIPMIAVDYFFLFLVPFLIGILFTYIGRHI